jgi:hypothetical protein
VRSTRELERALERPADGVFSESELEGLPEPVARAFRAAIAPGTPLALSARITIRGRIRLKGWTRFRGRELIAPHAGFVWAVRAGLISGYDRYAHGEGEMRWSLLGLIPVMRASGPDVNRSAAGRVGGEGVWIPTALLPRFGVGWSALDDNHLIARLRLDAHELEYHYLLDDQARIVATWFERWGDPDSSGRFGVHRFGVETTAFHTFHGLTIPAQGCAGWHYGSSRWPADVFFEYEITDLAPHTR